MSILKPPQHNVQREGERVRRSHAALQPQGNKIRGRAPCVGEQTLANSQDTIKVQMSLSLPREMGPAVPAHQTADARQTHRVEVQGTGACSLR